VDTKKSKTLVSELRGEIADVLKRRGYEIELFNGGGTGSLNITSEEPWLTELAAGSGFLCSHLFDYFSNIRFQPACFFACQVVRTSDDEYATCQGGGYIASGSVGWDKQPLPWLPQGLKLVNTEGCGEVPDTSQTAPGISSRSGRPDRLPTRQSRGNRPNVSTNTFWWKKIKSWTALRPTAGLGSVSFRSCLNIALWPNLFVRVDFQVLEIPQYSCAPENRLFLDLGP
jgi:hypothetical protein